MACEIQYFDLGYHEVHFDHALGLVCQNIGGDVTAENQQCYGPNGAFYNGATGLAATYDEIAKCYGVDTQPIIVPGTPPATDPAVQQALDALTAAVDAIAGVIQAVSDEQKNVVETQLNGIASQITGIQSAITAAISGAVTGIETTIGTSAWDIKSKVDQDAASLTTTVNNASASLTKQVADTAAATQATISGIGTTISQAIGTETALIDQTVTGVGKSITDAIANETTAITSAITGIADGIVQGISNILNSLLPGLLDTLSANTAALSGFVKSLESNLMSGDELTGLLSKSIGTAMMGPAEPLIQLLFTTLGKPLGELLDKGEDAIAGPLVGLMDMILDDPNTPDTLKQLLTPLRHRQHFWFLLALPFVLAQLSEKVIDAFAKPFYRHLEQKGNALSQQEIPNIEQLLLGDKRALAIENGLDYQAKQLGWPQWAVGLLRENQWQRLTPREYVELWFREYLSDDELTRKLSEANYNPYQQNDLINHSKFVPQPQDVIRFLTRDVYFPDFVRDFGMDANFDEAWQTARADFAHVGVSEDTARSFWRAHWILPSITEGYNLYHRAAADGQGDGVALPDGTVIRRLIPRDSLSRLLRAQGVEPYWRDAQIAAAFRPLTRIDLRRAYAAGVITDSDVYAGYINLGYDEQHAQVLTSLTVQLATDAKEVKLEPWATGIRSRLMTAFEAGTLSEKGFRDALAASHFVPSAIDDAVTAALTVRATHRTAELLAGIKPLYVNDDWTTDQTRARLSASGLDDEESNEILALWNLTKEFRADNATTRGHKDATKAEVLAGYEQSLLTREQASAMLTAMKLSVTEVGLALGLADHKIAKADLAAEVAAIKAEFIAGHADLPTTSAALDHLQLSVAQRGSYLRRWETELAGKAKSLPISDVKALHQQGIYSDAQAEQVLRLERYSDSDIASLIKLWDAEGAQDRTKAAAKAKAAADRAARAAKAKADKEAKAALPKVHELSASDVAKAVTAGILTTAQGLAELQTLGYSATDAAIYLTEKGVTDSTIPPETTPT